MATRRKPALGEDSEWRSSAPTRIHAGAARLSLTATAGALAGQVFGSDGEPLTLGRGEGCAVVLRSPDVSRRHTRIEYRAGQYWVSDLGTLNGTRLNGALLGQPLPLAEGDRVALGSQELVAS